MPSSDDGGVRPLRVTPRILRGAEFHVSVLSIAASRAAQMPRGFLASDESDHPTLPASGALVMIEPMSEVQGSLQPEGHRDLHTRGHRFVLGGGLILPTGFHVADGSLIQPRIAA